MCGQGNHRRVKVKPKHSQSLKRGVFLEVLKTDSSCGLSLVNIKQKLSPKLVQMWLVSYNFGQAAVSFSTVWCVQNYRSRKSCFSLERDPSAMYLQIGAHNDKLMSFQVWPLSFWTHRIVCVVWERHHLIRGCFPLESHSLCFIGYDSIICCHLLSDGFC